MKSIIPLIMVVNSALIGCASERLQVSVIDNVGNPVSNATVSVGFSKSHTLFGGGLSSKIASVNVKSKTDAKGVAVVKFNCTSSDFGWKVVADGYYPGNFHHENFKGEDMIIPPGFGTIILHEHEKAGKEILCKIVNPQPM